MKFDNQGYIRMTYNAAEFHFRILTYVFGVTLANQQFAASHTVFTSRVDWVICAFTHYYQWNGMLFVGSVTIT